MSLPANSKRHADATNRLNPKENHMPRRRIPVDPLPRRLDRRRSGGNAMDAQRRPRRGRRGQAETIAERRTFALELRKAGGSYREIARQLGVDLQTAHSDVAAELGALREMTVEHAKQLRDLELARFDEMTSGLWPQIRAGSPPAVTAAVRVSERRSRLLGLDEPTATKTEISGSLSVDAERRLKAETEDLQRWLTYEELHPTRTIGVVRYKSHSRTLHRDVDSLRTIPALLLAGGDDPVAGTEDAEKLWRQGRALEAPWTFGIQPGQGHLAGLELATAFMLSWIEGVMHHRLAGGKLRDIDPAITWRADNRNSRIDPGRALAADLPHTSWLPDEKTAKLWQEVVGGK
jgi:hypothetical protein